MLETIFSRLLVGDADIAGQFAAAKPFWDEFFIEHGDKPEAELADVLTITQSQFYTKVAPGDYNVSEVLLPSCAGWWRSGDPSSFWRGRRLVCQVICQLMGTVSVVWRC